MRKFKLIKEFPLSPAKGTIATFKTMQEEEEGIYDMGAIPNLILTDCTQFPEFWEEVKEQEFEILEFIYTRNNIPTAFGEKFDLKFLPLYVDEGYKISKIRRLSDNENFSIGDKVTYIYKANYAPWTIDNFFIRTDGKILARNKNNSICEIVSEIKKSPEPLFVTEDKIEIFDEFQEIFGVNLKDYITYSTEVNSIRNKHLNKFFSTRKAAEGYIYENKPIYSKKQIKEAVESSFVRENYILDVPCCCADRFKEAIFKQKLGL